jgi:hypothetical protein
LHLSLNLFFLLVREVERVTQAQTEADRSRCELLDVVHSQNKGFVSVLILLIHDRTVKTLKSLVYELLGLLNLVLNVVKLVNPETQLLQVCSANSDKFNFSAGSRSFQKRIIFCVELRTLQINFPLVFSSVF